MGISRKTTSAIYHRALVLPLLLAAVVVPEVVGNSHEPGRRVAVIVEAPEERTAILPCPSNDDDHRFLYWQLEDDRVVGPPNNTSRLAKYYYEVLSGDLHIRHVSTEDAGHYRCISKGIGKPTYLIEPVDLVVKRDWELLWENDTTVNVLRGVLALVVIAVMCGIGFVVFRLKRSGYVKSDDLSDDDLPEEIVDDNPYQSTTQRVSPHQEDLNICMVDTELPRALNSMYSDRL